MLSTFYLPKEAEAQKSKVICPKPHSHQVAGLGFEPRMGDIEDLARRLQAPPRSLGSAPPPFLAHDGLRVLYSQSPVSLHQAEPSPALEKNQMCAVSGQRSISFLLALI